MSNHIPLLLVKSLASKVGFQDCGASKAERLPSDFFSNYLNLNYNASMLYLEKNIDKRLDPTLLLEGAKTIFSFVLSYNNGFKPDTELRIASYALCNDYHKLIKSKLYLIAQQIKEIYPNFQFKICVDSVPIFEKIWAKKAKLGSIGKNSLFVSKDYGSKVLLGEIICNFESDYCEVEDDDPCGNCDLCLNACPNHAIDFNRNVNANLCISFHTKINKGQIPHNIDTQHYIFGCDICLDVCPHNNKAYINRNEDMQPQKPIIDLLTKISQGSFTTSDLQIARKTSGLEDIKYEKLLSNIAFATRVK
ncbi:MAG: tRNA epoxyqueuosine(34) reductase QueG [Bacteroidales bacterium]|jgi:epoxyqueuosine reductase|nr:tRNA epoxyqueuosine(34) reductase QueG [Bacteroidales bacterium]